MKKLALLLAAVLALASLGGCGEREIKQPKAPEDLERTGELLLYLPENDTVLRGALPAYQKLFPEVEVTTVEVEREAYPERIAAELMAGRGPDVVSFLWTTFPDLYKTMDAGSFLDHSPLREADGEFRREEFVKPVLDAGGYRGKQYLLPVDYALANLVSERGILESLGLGGLPETADFKAFWAKVAAAYPQMRENPNFRSVMGEIIPNHLLAYSGVRLVDRETGTVFPDEEGLMALTEMYRAVVYGCGLTELYHTPDMANALRTGETPFFCESNIVVFNYFTQTGAAARAAGTPVTMPLTGPDGGRYAMPLNMVAVNAGSKNARNAWEFLKVVLSEEVQGEKGTLAVRKSAPKLYLEEHLPGFLEFTGEQLGLELTWTEEEIDGYLAPLQSPDDCLLFENHLWDLYRECMEPYCAGAADYGTCLEALRDKLALYLSE